MDIGWWQRLACEPHPYCLLAWWCKIRWSPRAATELLAAK